MCLRLTVNSMSCNTMKGREGVGGLHAGGGRGWHMLGHAKRGADSATLHCHLAPLGTVGPGMWKGPQGNARAKLDCG